MTDPIAMDAVLFDLDGTLIDTAPDFATVLNQMLSANQRPTLPFEQIRQQVSNGARAMVTLGFGKETEISDFAPRLAEFLERYQGHLAVDSALFRGLEQSLELLESCGVPWGIVTNKPSQYAIPLLAGLSLDQRCSVLVCPDQVQQKKPDPESLFLACNQLAVNPQHCVYVGDHKRDIEAGSRAGNYTIAAAWGYIDEQDDPNHWGADLICDSPHSFNHWLQLQLEKRT